MDMFIVFLKEVKHFLNSRYTRDESKENLFSTEQDDIQVYFLVHTKIKNRLVHCEVHSFA